VTEPDARKDSDSPAANASAATPAQDALAEPGKAAEPTRPATSESPAPGADAPAAAAQPAEAGRGRGSPVGWVALLLALVAVAVAAFQWQRGEAVAREAARRLQQEEGRIAALEGQFKQSQDLVRELQGRSALLESKIAESIGQQSQLEQMYRSIVQDSLGATLAEVENAIAIASQQLVVSGNVRGALIAMQDADGRLKRINQPEALGLRRMIAADIERLKAVPLVDVVGLAIRLDSVAASVAQLPLLADLSSPPGQAGASEGAVADKAQTAKPGSDGKGQGAPNGAKGSTDVAGTQAAAPGATEPAFSFARLASTGRQGWQALLDELSQLFQVSRVDAPDVVLLAPEQRYFVRENLRLTLLSARLALLARAEPLFRADLDRAIHSLESYFDPRNRGVANAVAALKQLRQSTISVELPSLGDTLSAVRAARAAREGNS